jgi:hypothetical protein
VNALLFFHATLSVCVLLTASYVWQQYKGNILFSFHGNNVAINKNTALFLEKVVRSLFYIVDSDSLNTQRSQNWLCEGATMLVGTYLLSWLLQSIILLLGSSSLNWTAKRWLQLDAQLNASRCLLEAAKNGADVKDEVDIVKLHKLHMLEWVIDVEEETNRDSNSARLNKWNVKVTVANSEGKLHQRPVSRRVWFRADRSVSRKDVQKC